MVNRVDHSQSGAVMAFRILDRMNFPPEEIAAIVTAFTCPLITAMLDKRMRRLKKGIYSDEAVAEQAAQAKK